MQRKPITMGAPEHVLDRLRVLDQLFGDPSNGKGRTFIKFCFCEEEQQTWLCLSRPLAAMRLIDKDGSALTRERLMWLKGEEAILYQDDPPEGTDVFGIWEKIYWVFLAPLSELIPVNFIGYIFVQFDPTIAKMDDGPFINLQAIYDRSFFYTDNPDIVKWTLVYISDPEPIRFLRKLFSSIRPLARQVDILYGFPTNDKSPDGQFREDTFRKGREAAARQGARVQTLDTLYQLEQLFSLGQEGRVLQLLTHFGFERIFTPNLRKWIRVKDLEELIGRMFREDRLRDDICIHAATCDNFSFFKLLYARGIKNIYYSSNELSTDEMAAMFWELYEGGNAVKIGLPFPYLDGESFIFEAWTRVCRCFFRNAFMGNKIEII